MNLKIRQMTESDIPDIQVVVRKSWNYAYHNIIPEKIQNNFLNLAYSYSMLKKRLNKDLYLVAENENKIIGFINLSETSQIYKYNLTALYLLPEFQRKGIGTQLLIYSFQFLENPKEIFVEVEKENIIGVNFYKKLGFKIIDEYNEDFDGHILKTLKMSISSDNCLPFYESDLH